MKVVFSISNDWLFLFIYLTAILAILPFSGPVAQYIAETNPFFASLVSIAVSLAAGLIGVGLAAYVIVTDKRFKLARLLALAVILVAGMKGLGEFYNPHEKLHIIEYSILAFFLFKALRFRNPTQALYLWCVIFIAIAAFADEAGA